MSENVEEIKPWELTTEQFREKAFEYSAGRTFEPGSWPNNARVAVLISFDVDNESMIAMQDCDPLMASVHQFGGQKGTKRLVNLLDKYEVPATFFTPAALFALQPELAPTITRSGLHEIGVHGWIHEKASSMTPEEQRHYLKKCIDEIENVTGQRPVGYRAPFGDFTEHTLPALKEQGFLYDSSLVADDVPYELLYQGKPSGLISLPPSIDLEDSVLDPISPYTTGILPPNGVLQSYKDTFDVAYEEGGIFLTLMHPHVIGRQSRISVLKDFIEYAKSHEGVWFCTHRDAAEHFSKQLNA